MTTLTITAEGELTLDKRLLTHLGFAPGDQVVVEPLPGGRLEVRRPRGSGKISDVAGFLRDENGPRLTIDEINEATAKGWAGER